MFINSGKIWEEIEKEKAKIRQAINGSQNLGLKLDNVPCLEDKGAVRDIIASKVGIGSGRTYERARVVIDKIEELNKNKNDIDAEFLKAILNESVRGARVTRELKSLVR